MNFSGSRTRSEQSGYAASFGTSDSRLDETHPGPARTCRQFRNARRGGPGSRARQVRKRRFKEPLCPGCPRREGLYLYVTRSERLGPEVRLVGAPIVAYRKGNRSEPALAGYQHFGGGSDEPLKPYRSYPADLTSRPQRQSSLSDSLGGVERARAWPDHRHGFATSGPQRHWQSWGVVRALPSACSVLRYARSDPAAGSDKY